MNKQIILSGLAVLSLNACAKGSLPSMNQPNSSVNNMNLGTQANPRFIPVPINQTQRFVVAFDVLDVSFRVEQLIYFSAQSYIEKSKLEYDGDIDNFTSEYSRHFQGNSNNGIVSLLLNGVKDGDLIKHEVFHNLANYIYNDTKKNHPEVKIMSIRLMDNTTSQSILMDTIDY